MIIIDLEKAYDRFLREVLWQMLEKKGIFIRYTNVTKDVDGGVTSVRTHGGNSSKFPITIGLHQGSILSPYIFVLVMNVLTRHI